MKRLIFILTLASSWAATQKLSSTPFKASGIYDLNEKAGWTVTGSGSAHYGIRKKNLDTIQSGGLDLSTGAATISAALSEPAMVYVEVTGGPAPVHLGAAVAPTQLQRSVPHPADFDSFWDAKLKALAKIDINPMLTPTPTQ